MTSRTRAEQVPVALQTQGSYSQARKMISREMSDTGSKVYRINPLHTIYTKWTGTFTVLPAPLQSVKVGGLHF